MVNSMSCPARPGRFVKISYMVPSLDSRAEQAGIVKLSYTFEKFSAARESLDIVWGLVRDESGAMDLEPRIR